MSHVVELREVIESDLPILFEHQADPIANEMAAFPARDRDAFLAHWAKILVDESNITKTVLYNGEVVGTVMCFILEGKREVGCGDRPPVVHRSIRPYGDGARSPRRQRARSPRGRARPAPA